MSTKVEKTGSRKSGGSLIAALMLICAMATSTLVAQNVARANVIQVKYTGYKPTGVFETELRYFYEVSGVRSYLENMEKQLLEQFKKTLLSQYPDDRKQVDKMIDILSEESLSLDDVIKAYMPVYKKYYTIEELQELNKFYSTDLMQSMVKKNPSIAQELAPIQMELLTDHAEKLKKRLTQALE
ncbi:DUF2059 domain-containing protein [Prosthecochloris sp. SCSIO W1102]|uniref:DUF2059 domain-containing protein n=1 Tax=Prosthecochloris sp. SCSIO W1102 TaxID=2992243 RepID=UPI00223E240B|nr:DUF2059 domain-containing protein [Prosthecochloris sp. SCSIO W1102]UZJ40057.1 DUF2059 domain-containing protein [Prosthecochloris sp. SCSIO W1102]